MMLNITTIWKRNKRPQDFYLIICINSHISLITQTTGTILQVAGRHVDTLDQWIDQYVHIL